MFSRFDTKPGRFRQSTKGRSNRYLATVLRVSLINVRARLGGYVRTVRLSVLLIFGMVCHLTIRIFIASQVQALR